MDTDPRLLGDRFNVRHHRRRLSTYRYSWKIRLPRPPPGTYTPCLKSPLQPLKSFQNKSLIILTQFFFNFGANSTTFIVPAELFPTRVRGFAHGFSAAAGKGGAILSALLFNYLSGPKVLGLANVLWMFFACCLLGAAITYFLIPETKGRDADVTDYEEWMEMNIVER